MIGPHRFPAIKLGGLARSTFAVMAWNLIRLATQLLWVILLARALGVQGYGMFSGIAGLALALSGFVGAGLGLLMYQDVARDPANFGKRWAQSSRSLVWSSAAIAACFVAIAAWAFEDVTAATLVAVAAAELVGTPIVVQVAFAYAAHGRVAEAAASPVVLSIARVLAILALPWVSESPNMQAYAWLHATSTLVAATALWIRCVHQLSPPPAQAGLEVRALTQGAQLASTWASGQALATVDKAMTLRAAGADIAGQYTAAHRLASLVTLPVDALVAAALPRLFRENSAKPSFNNLLSWLVLATVGYGVLAGSALWIGAATLTSILGSEFSSATPALTVLAVFVPGYCLRSLGANILLGYGWTRWRLGSELAALVAMALMVAAWSPAGAVGAAWAVVVTEWALAACFWSRIMAGSFNLNSTRKT
jgi:O-antigen/teichoic acid export membrane protein